MTSPSHFHDVPGEGPGSPVPAPSSSPTPSSDRRPPSRRILHLRRALLPGGWADDVVLEVDGAGVITAVHRGGAGNRPPGRTREGAGSPPGEPGPTEAPDAHLGVTVPGVANLHSHAFQRAMAGLAERRGGEGTESFWSWRRVMYALAERLEPEQVETIAGLAYCEMLESGFTAVGEFHYLHHAPDGAPYDDPAEMAAAICAAAGTTGIALTLLPVLYRHGDVGGAPPAEGQRRFVSDLDGYAALVTGARRHAGRVAHARVGIAPHSLRAVTAAEIATVLPLADGGPVHIHAAEQEAEVQRCLELLGARPVQHLLDAVEVDERWCLVHCTHLEPPEVRGVAAAGAVVGFCPLTEANLGDGVAPAAELLAAGGRFGVGTDSHIRIDLAEELRLLEYGQRLVSRRRTVLAPPGASTGRSLFEAAATGGAQALGGSAGRIAVGARADLVVLDDTHTRSVGRSHDALLDSWILTGDARQVREVWVAGRRVVADGRALAREAVDRRWRHLTGEWGSWEGATSAGGGSGAGKDR